MAHPTDRGLFRYDLSDHHAVLGVPIGADAALVRRRYLTIAQRLHPDTCRASSEAEKQRASQLLSKLVNPAYQELSRDRSRNDYLLVLAQRSKILVQEAGQISLASESARQLLQASQESLELTYHKLLQSLLPHQYADLDAVGQQIGHLSELNLVYLMKREGQGRSESKLSSRQPAKKAAPQPASPPPPPLETVPTQPYLRRARECLERENLTQALLELRDALKLDPNDSNCHSLLGLTYLKQNQVTMAKIHIQKAEAIDPQNPKVLAAKQELKKAMPEANRPKSGGLFGGWFGGKNDS